MEPFLDHLKSNIKPLPDFGHMNFNVGIISYDGLRETLDEKTSKELIENVQM